MSRPTGSRTRPQGPTRPNRQPLHALGTDFPRAVFRDPGEGFRAAVPARDHEGGGGEERAVAGKVDGDLAFAGAGGKVGLELGVAALRNVSVG